MGGIVHAHVAIPCALGYLGVGVVFVVRVGVGFGAFFVPELIAGGVGHVGVDFIPAPIGVDGVGDFGEEYE